MSTTGFPAAGRSQRLRRQVRREQDFVRRAARDPLTVARRIRWTASPRVAYLDLGHDPRRALLLAGSGRSGSTWLSEVLVEAYRCRVVFEPWRLDRLRPPGMPAWGCYVDPDADDPELRDAFERILAGRCRSRWTDQANRQRLARSRVVKEIRANTLLPWVVAQFPRTPVVYLLRHPVPSALSAAALGWDPQLEDFLDQGPLLEGPLAPFAELARRHAAGDDLFHRHVLRWCLENVVPVELLAPGSAHVVFYERAAEDPRAEFDRVCGFLARFADAGWSAAPRRSPDFGRQSLTNYRGSRVRHGPAGAAPWLDQVDPGALGRAVDLVAAFGLDRLYGAGPAPLVDPDRVLLGTPRG